MLIPELKAGCHQPQRISTSQSRARTRLPLKAERAKGITRSTQAFRCTGKAKSRQGLPVHRKSFDGYQFNASDCRCGLAPVWLAWNLLVVTVRHPGRQRPWCRTQKPVVATEESLAKLMEANPRPVGGRIADADGLGEHWHARSSEMLPCQDFSSERKIVAEFMSICILDWTTKKTSCHPSNFQFR